MFLKEVIMHPDVAVELIIGNNDEIRMAVDCATKAGVTVWIYGGSIGEIFKKLEEKTDKSTAWKDVTQLCGEFQILSVLASDFPVGNHDIEPSFSSILEYQLCKAVERLGKGAFLLVPENCDEFNGFSALKSNELISLLSCRRNNSRNIPFIDLHAQQDRIRPLLEERIWRVMRHGQYVMGPEIKELEESLASYVGVSHCIACSSGTDALLMSLMALGVGPGDAVFLPSFTFIATAEVVRLVGATPVFVDIDPETLLIDADHLQRALTALRNRDPSLYPLPLCHSELKPKAVITVDLFGNMPDYEAIEAIAEKEKLFLVEDAAQSFGASFSGRRAGAFGDIACTSFFPAKPLGCYGDGGAVFTDREELAQIVRSIRMHGAGSDRYEHVRLGLNGRMDTLQAAVLLCKLAIFNDELGRRKNTVELYRKELSQVPGVAFQRVEDNVQSAWAQFCILVPDPDTRDRIREFLAAEGIPTAVYYPLPLHLQPVFSDLGYKRGDLPVSEGCAEKILALPMHPYVERCVIEQCAKIVNYYVLQDRASGRGSSPHPEDPQRDSCFSEE